jgi:hypothetical protein
MSLWKEHQVPKVLTLSRCVTSGESPTSLGLHFLTYKVRGVISTHLTGLSQEEPMRKWIQKCLGTILFMADFHPDLTQAGSCSKSQSVYLNSSYR